MDFKFKFYFLAVILFLNKQKYLKILFLLTFLVHSKLNMVYSLCLGVFYCVRRGCQ